MKKIYLLFTLFLFVAALPIHSEVGKGSIRFTSRKAANAKIKLTIETGTAAETKLNETFTVSGAKVNTAKGGKLELIIENPDNTIIIQGDLTRFKCERAELTKLDLTQATTLRKLECKRNKLSELDATSLSNIEELNCSFNEIKTLDLEECIRLKKAIFGSNYINNLYLPESEVLTFIDCSVNQSINNFDFSKCKALKTLKCYTCGIDENKAERLVSQLPTQSAGAKIYVRFGSTGSYPFTKRHIRTLKAKGWTAYDTDNNICEGTEDWGIIRFETVKGAILSFNTNPAPNVGSDVILGKDITYDAAFSYGNMAQLACKKAGSYTIKCRQAEIWFSITRFSKSPYAVSKIDFSDDPYLKKFTATELGASTIILPVNAERIKVTNSGWLTKVEIPRNNHLINLNLAECNKLSTLDLTDSPQLEQLNISEGHLEQLSIARCPSLKTILCYGNCLKKEAFDKLVADITDHSAENSTTYRIVLHSDLMNERNYCSRTQAEALKAKGWTVLEINNGKERSYTGVEGNDPYIDKKEGGEQFGTEQLVISFDDLREKIHCTKISINNEEQTLRQIKANANMWIDGVATIGKDDYGFTFRAADNKVTLHGQITEIENLGNVMGVVDVDASKAISLKRLMLDNRHTGIRSLIMPKSNAMTDLSIAGPNNITQIDMTGCKGIKNIYLGNCPIKEFNLTDAVNMESLRLDNLWELTKLVLPEESSLKVLHIKNISIKKFGLVIPQTVEELLLIGFGDSRLPVIPSTLRKLNCARNEKLSMLPALPSTLQELNCNDCSLTTLDLSQCSDLTMLSMSGNNIHRVDFPAKSKLNKIVCEDNSITENEMTAFIEALPATTNGTLQIWNYENSRQNHCNTLHVAAANKKGWNVVDSKGNPYPGITPTGISTPAISDKDNAPYYDLQGRRIAKPTRSGIYIHNGKKIIIK